MSGRARVAWNLRRLRTARQMSQEALAFDAEVDRTSISGIENESFNPSIDLLDRLATVLDADIAEFLKEVQAGDELPAPLKRGRRPKR